MAAASSATITPTDFVGTIRALWAAYGNLKAIEGLIERCPLNPWISLMIDHRPDRSDCSDRKLTNKQCDVQYNEPVRSSDAAAHFGGRVEMIVWLVAFVAYPIWVNWIKGKRPSFAQLVVHATSAGALFAATWGRGYLAYHSPKFLANEQHCVDFASAIVFGLLAIAMWIALPPPDELVKTFNAFAQTQKAYNQDRAGDYKEISTNIRGMSETLGALVDRLNTQTAHEPLPPSTRNRR